jgi:hypothetical protein
MYWMLTEIPPAPDAASLRRAWGDHINRYAWDVVLTLSSATCASRDRIHRELRRFFHRLERAGKAPVWWFYALERGAGGMLHAHVLAASPAPVFTALRNHWRLGNVTVKRFDRQLGGAYYVVKEFGSGVLDDYMMSSDMPPNVDPLVSSRFR